MSYQKFYEGGEDGPKPPKQTDGERKKEKYSEEVDKFTCKELQGMEKGVNRNRKCQDILCFGIFLAFIGGMMGLVIYGFKNGDPKKMLAPYDGMKNFCGIDNTKDFVGGLDCTDYPNLFFPSLQPSAMQADFNIFADAVCVKQCPGSKRPTIECPKYPTNLINGANFSAICSNNNYNSTIDVISVCVPTKTNDGTKFMISQLKKNQAVQYLLSLSDSKYVILIGMGTAFLYSLAFIYLMSIFGEVLSWIVIVLIQVGLISGSVVGIYAYAKSKQIFAEGDTASPSIALTVGIVLAILSVVFFCMLCYGFRALKTAIDVIDASADFLAGTKRIILVPVLYFFVTLIVIFLWLLALACIYSIGTITAAPNSEFGLQNRSVKLDGKNEKQFFVLSFLFMLFGLFWICQFINAKTKFIAMVSASTYYFNSSKDKEGSSEVSLGFQYAYMYHMGTLAFGSFIIALVEFIRYVFVYTSQAIARQSGNNAAVVCLIRCANCILKCVEKVCDYINTSAYAFCAVSGNSFCDGAYNGMLLNLKHGMEFAFAQTLAIGFIWLGKLGLTALNCFTCYFVIKYMQKKQALENPEIEQVTQSSIYTQLVIVGAFTYITVSIFLSLFDEAVVALLTCHAIDTDLHGIPKYGPPTFHDGEKLEKMKPQSAGKKTSDQYQKVNNQQKTSQNQIQ